MAKTLTCVFVIIAICLSFGEKLKRITSTCSIGNSELKWNRKGVSKNLKDWVTSVKKAEENTENSLELKVSFYNLSSGSLSLKILDSPDASWKVPGGGWLEQATHNGYVYNDSRTGSDSIYIYPDFKHVLVGAFNSTNNRLIRAKESRIIAEKCQNGVKRIRIAKPKPDSPEVIYSRPRETLIGDQPTVMDPLERGRVFVADGVVGDGLFAKKDLEKGDLVAYYSGTIFPEHYINLANMTQDEIWKWHTNLMSLFSMPDIKFNMNVPPEYSSITKYRATLGHKTNHSFVKNSTDFGYCYHPRFGHIRNLVATKNISKGEEIFVNYKYNMERVPDWYFKLYLREIKGKG